MTLLIAGALLLDGILFLCAGWSLAGGASGLVGCLWLFAMMHGESS